MEQPAFCSAPQTATNIQDPPVAAKVYIPFAALYSFGFIVALKNAGKEEFVIA